MPFLIKALALRASIVLFFIFHLFQASISQSASGVNIIPAPQSVVQTAGTTTVSSGNVIYYDVPVFQPIADLLKDELFRTHGLTLTTSQGSAAGPGDILIKSNTGLSGERYLLSVDGSITVEADGIHGAFPGTVSVVQALSSSAAGSATAQNVNIDDQPFKDFRSVMIDVKNYWYSLDDIKAFIKLARFYKVRYLSLHTGEKQWIGAVVDQTSGFTAAQRAAHHLYTKEEMNELIQFGKSHGVYLFPHNESTPNHRHMLDAMQKDFNPNDAFAGFADELDGLGSFANFDGTEGNARFRNVVSIAHRRAIDQFKAGYPADLKMPMYHVGPVISEGGMSDNLADFFRGVLVGYDADVKMSYWAGPSTTGGPLAAHKDQVVPICYTKQFHPTYESHLSNGWTIANAAWSPLYIVGSSIARPVEMVYNEWNHFRGGTDGISGGPITYDNFTGVNDANVLGGLMCTWENSSSINLALLKLRMPAFAEHAWNHKTWPYPANDFDDYTSRATVTQSIGDLFISNGQAPSTPQTTSASDGLFPDKIRVTWTAASNGPITYQLYRNTSNNSSSATVITTVTSDITTYEDTNVSANTDYYYWVKAQNNSGDSGFSQSNSGSIGNGGGLVLAHEPFDYTPGNVIVGENGGTGWTDQWSLLSNNGSATINNFGLTYPGLVTSGNSICLEPASDTPSIVIARNTSGQIGAEGTSTWISFLMKVDRLRNGHFALFPNTAFDYGLTKRWGSKLLNTTAVEGETYFVVMQIENVPGKDMHRTWLNPEIGIIPSPSNTATINDNVDLGNGNLITINMQGYGLGKINVDEIRVGSSFQDVMPALNNNCPTGVVVGATCDDADSCTTNDMIDANCDCTGTLVDANNNGLCDTQESCLSQAFDGFDYASNTLIDATAGGSGFGSAWTVPSAMNGSIEVISGSLNYPGQMTSSVANKLRFTLTNENSTKYANRDLATSFTTGDEVWMSCLINPIKIANGGFWIKPNGRQDIAIGKRWGTQLSIDNTSTGIDVQANTTYKLVVRYKLESGQTVAHLWVNRNDGFTDANADVTKTIGAISSINSVQIAMERWEDGIVEIDELYLGCTAEMPVVCANGVAVGGACDDGDVCTTGEVYDSNCECIGGTLVDANNNGVCDSEEVVCASEATEAFLYPANTLLNGSTGGSGFSSAWTAPNAMNGSIEVTSGSLTYAGHTSSANKLRMTLTNENSTKWVTRDLAQPFVNGEEVWMSCLISPIKRENGGFWIKPNGRQDIAFGKRWGSQLSIDNNASSTDVQNNGIYKLVVRYKLENTQTVAHLWINRNEDYTDANADATKTVGTISDINSIQIAMERWGDGIMEIDELYIGCSLDAADSCDSSMVGTACDDGDACTTGEAYDSNCECNGGTFQDADSDGICDANDNTNGNCILGATCNDNNDCTTGEAYDANCNCTGGTISPDTDGDGLCDAADPCPNDSADACLDNCDNLLPQQTNLVLGGRNILVLRGVDPATHTWDVPDENITTIQTKLDDYVRRLSFERAWIGDFDITPVYEFDASTNKSFTYMSDLLRDAAEAGGYDLSQYNVIIYTYRSTTDLNGAGALGSGNGLNGSVWYPGQLLWYYKGVIHETFHGFGLGHANALEGGDVMFPGSVTGGHDPYYFMGSEGDGGLDSDIPSYMKYFLGWIEPEEIACVPEVNNTCITRRIHKSSGVNTYNEQHKYGLQLGDNLWLSYEPDNQNTRIVKKGVLLHHIPGPGSAITNMLDPTPNSITVRPPELPSNWDPVIDLWDAALEVGDEINWEGTNIKVAAVGGTGEQKWVDLELCDCTVLSGDSDNDGVCDAMDECPNFNDALDADEDNTPDACDVCPDDPFNDSNNDGICDNFQCLNEAADAFDYTAGSALIGAGGGPGLSGDWTGPVLNGSINIESGSLSYPGHISQGGNKVSIDLEGEDATKYVLRQLSTPFMNGSEVWMSILIRPTELANGGFWIKPDNNQDLAIGKRWGTELAINNSGTGINVQQGTVYKLVVRYQMKQNETVAHLWVNRNSGYTDANADATRTIGRMNDISEVVIAMERWDDGAFEFDDLSFDCGPNAGCSSALAGTNCSDGDPCTVGEVYDADCRCIGGTLLDTNNNGICDFDDPSCEDYIYETINQAITQTQKAVIGVETNGVISSGTTVDYHAGQYVQMNPGFEVKSGAVYHAYIEACND